MKAVQLCLQLQQDALCTAGVHCHSFVFINSGTAQRTDEQPFGREDLSYIEQDNCIATRTCLLRLLCAVRYVYFFIEQPSSSRLFNEAATLLHASVPELFATWLKPQFSFNVHACVLGNINACAIHCGTKGPEPPSHVEVLLLISSSVSAGGMSSSSDSRGLSPYCRNTCL